MYHLHQNFIANLETAAGDAFPLSSSTPPPIFIVCSQLVFWHHHRKINIFPYCQKQTLHPSRSQSLKCSTSSVGLDRYGCVFAFFCDFSQITRSFRSFIILRLQRQRRLERQKSQPSILSLINECDLCLRSILHHHNIRGINVVGDICDKE